MSRRCAICEDQAEECRFCRAERPTQPDAERPSDGEVDLVVAALAEGTPEQTTARRLLAYTKRLEADFNVIWERYRRQSDAAGRAANRATDAEMQIARLRERAEAATADRDNWQRTSRDFQVANSKLLDKLEAAEKRVAELEAEREIIDRVDRERAADDAARIADLERQLAEASFERDSNRGKLAVEQGRVAELTSQLAEARGLICCAEYAEGGEHESDCAFTERDQLRSELSALKGEGGERRHMYWRAETDDGNSRFMNEHGARVWLGMPPEVPDWRIVKVIEETVDASGSYRVLSGAGSEGSK